MRLGGLIAIYTLCRIIFYCFNLSYFPDAHLSYFFSGIRFDMAAIVITNAPYFLLLLLPFSFIAKKAKKVGDIYFVIVNTIAVMANLIDVCYYPFSLRRMTSDIFDFIGATNNFGTLIPVFLKDYFYMIFIFAAFIVMLILLVFYTNRIDYQGFVLKGKHFWIQVSARVIIVAALLVGARGGLQLRPLTGSAAAAAGGIEYASLILNTPFTLITTSSTDKLPQKEYFTEETCEQTFSTKRYSFDNQYFDPPQTDNIVVIILEGFAADYSTYFADKPQKFAGFTPFLDSLAQQSITFRGMANGQHSIEAVASILGGIPSLMDKPFSQSQYATNYIQYAIPALKARGMRTSFYHGGENGTMGFDRCCQVIGIENYYGMNEYPNAKRDNDGSWGIADMPYLNYVADQLSQEKGPFFSTIFTLSSHHPFKVPDEYDNVVKKGEIPMQHTVAYTDLALKKFFEKISKTDWYQNTLFVIVADHTTYDDAQGVDFQRNRYHIPILFFHPQQKAHFHVDEIMQQVDIMPSIFGFCGFTEHFVSFGNNVFDDSTPRFAIDYLAGTYQFYISHYLIEFDGNSIQKVWDLAQEMPRTPIASNAIENFNSYENLMKAVIQQFNNQLIGNKLL